MAKNFIELEKESNRRAAALKASEKVLEKEQREKEHLQREYNKGVLMRFVYSRSQCVWPAKFDLCLPTLFIIRRDKLEQVCREQQKLMKSIKSESMSKIRDEEEKRKETQAHFQKSINEIFATLGKNNDENVKIKEANLEMTKKFKYLAEQYELREKQLEKLNEQIKLETQLNEAKLAKVQMESTIEREILLKEKQTALEEILSSKKSLAEMETRERLLKEQLHVYTNKYDEFQNSLQKSNDIFTTYKTELEKMAKRTKVLEKECYEWRLKYEKCNRSLLNMVADKQAQDQYVQKSARQLAQLQKLCRTLQAERGTLLDVLKANNIERPPMPELPPEPKDIEPAPQPSDKLDAMTRNCNELKATLAQLQGQMNAISLEQKEKPKSKTNETAAAAATNKKSKAKKNKAKSKAEGDVAAKNAATAEPAVPNTTATEVETVTEGNTEAAQTVDDAGIAVDDEPAVAVNGTESSDIVTAVNGTTADEVPPIQAEIVQETATKSDPEPVDTAPSAAPVVEPVSVTASE